MKRILDIRVKKDVDVDAPFDHIGEYTDKDEQWVISRKHGEYLANLSEEEFWEIPPRGREFRFFKPYAGGEPEGSEDYQKYGKQDFERAEAYNRGDWYFMGIGARARVQMGKGSPIQYISSGGLRGVESDGNDEYQNETVQGQIAELRSELILMGFTKKSIDRAIESMEEE